MVWIERINTIVFAVFFMNLLVNVAAADDLEGDVGGKSEVAGIGEVTDFELDLAHGKEVEGELPTSVVGKNIRFILKNKLPRYSYHYKYWIEKDDVSLLPSNSIGSAEPKGEQEPGYINDKIAEFVTRKCTSLETEIDAFEMATFEDQVPGLLGKIQSEYEKIRKKEGSDGVPSGAARGCLAANGYRGGIEQIIDGTKGEITTRKISVGESIKFEIQRGSEIWKHTYSGGKRGEWRTSWGMAYFTQVSESWYSKSDGGSGFTIEKGASRTKMQVEPVVMWHWMNERNAASSFDCGWNAGIGLNLNNPTILIGANLSYNQNVVVSLGVAARQFAVLKSQYSQGDPVTSKIEAADLVEDVYKASPYLSVTFRFDNNPF